MLVKSIRKNHVVVLPSGVWRTVTDVCRHPECELISFTLEGDETIYTYPASKNVLWLTPVKSPKTKQGRYRK